MTTTTKTQSFTVERDALLSGLNAVGRVAGGRSGMLAVLSGIRIESTKTALALAATDLDVTLEVDLAIDNGVAGVTVLPAKLLTDAVRLLPSGQVHLVIEGAKATLRGGDVTFKLNVIEGDFPKLPSRDGEGAILPTADFVTAVSRVIAATSTEDSRPILTGVLFRPSKKGLQLIATDTYRAAVADFDHNVDVVQDDLVIPARALREVVRLVAGSDLDLTMQVREHDVTFSAGPASVTTRFIQGQYPDVMRLIPKKHAAKLTVNRLTVLGAIGRARLFARTPNTPVRFVIAGDTDVRVQGVDVDLGDSDEPVMGATFTGQEAMRIAFNASYIVDGIDAAEAEDVTIGMDDPLKPATVRTPGYTYLIMPVKIP